MRISGFSIARNVRKYNYPVVEAITAVLPICDEFIVNVGYSEDDTLGIIKSIDDPKIKIIETPWEKGQQPDILSFQTNVALKECTGDWAFYVQSDELIHEQDLPKLKKLMEKHLNDGTDALRFRWMHFYGSFYRYRIDRGWFQKQDRIIRNNGQIESTIDAWAFKRKDDQPLKQVKTGCLLYHYGWVHPPGIMTQRRVNSEDIYAPGLLDEDEKAKEYDYGDLGRFPPYFGSHPKVMERIIQSHKLSQDDLKGIERRFWWHPMKILKARYKTGHRVKERIV